MKLGAHRDGLSDSVRQADQVLWYAPPNLGWDLAATAARVLGACGRSAIP